MYRCDEDEDEEKCAPAKAASRFEGMTDQELAKRRILFLCEGVTAESARRLIKELLWLDFKEPGKPIFLMINSPGGSVTDGMAVYDIARALKSPVVTVVIGLAASMGSLLSILAKKEHRLAFPDARFMVHQPLISGRFQAVVSDVEIHAREIGKTKARLCQIYKEATGKSDAEIEQIIDRDSWFSADEALHFGLIGKVVRSIDEMLSVCK